MTSEVPTLDLDDAVRLYESGVNIAACSKRAGISHKRMRDEIARRGILRKRGGVLGNSIGTRPSDLPSDISARYLSGESENGIAVSLGVSRGTVRRRLVHDGVVLRDITEANRLMVGQRSPEENLANTQAAHAAKRGKANSYEMRCQAAVTREQRQTHTSASELLMKRWLEDRGVDSIAQKAIGPYNADLAIHPIAVEINGGGWHAYSHHRKRAPERTRYILDEGWNLLFVWVDLIRYPLTEAVADYIVSFVEEARRDPTLRGQYRVIRGNGQLQPTSGSDLNEVALVPPLS